MCCKASKNLLTKKKKNYCTAPANNVLIVEIKIFWSRRYFVHSLSFEPVCFRGLLCIFYKLQQLAQFMKHLNSDIQPSKASQNSSVTVVGRNTVLDFRIKKKFLYRLLPGPRAFAIFTELLVGKKTYSMYHRNGTWWSLGSFLPLFPPVVFLRFWPKSEKDVGKWEN